MNHTETKSHDSNSVSSQDKRIAKSFLWLSLFILIGKAAGAAKEMAIAWEYGIGEVVDAYVLVFTLINWPISVWFSVLVVMLVPIVADLKFRDQPGLRLFQGELFTVSLVTGSLLGIIAYISIPLLLKSPMSGLSVDSFQIAMRFVKPFSFLLPVGILIGFFSAWILAFDKHRNTLFEAVPALVLFIAILMPEEIVPAPLVWGTVAGMTLHLFILMTSLPVNAKFQWPKFSLSSGAWSGLWVSAIVVFSGQALMGVISVIDQFFATYLGAGSVSTLNYSNKITALILGFGATAVSRATLPVFSEAHVKGDAQLRSMVFRWAIRLFGLGILAMGLVWILSPWIVRVLFERGEFTELHTLAVSDVLRFSVLQVPAFMAALVFVSYLTSQSRYMLLLWSGVLALFTKVLLNYLFMPAMGVNGLAFSWLFVYFINATFFFLVIRR